MTYMSKIIYANLGAKRCVRTSTIQPAAAKLSKVHFNIFSALPMEVEGRTYWSEQRVQAGLGRYRQIKVAPINRIIS
jgi:hypothetical protein